METDFNIVYGLFPRPIFIPADAMKDHATLGRFVGGVLREGLSSGNDNFYLEEPLQELLKAGEIFQVQDQGLDGATNIWTVMRDRPGNRYVMLFGEKRPGRDLHLEVLDGPSMIPVGHLGRVSGRQGFITKGLITVMPVE